jgi:hypothetical protein
MVQQGIALPGGTVQILAADGAVIIDDAADNPPRIRGRQAAQLDDQSLQYPAVCLHLLAVVGFRPLSRFLADDFLQTCGIGQ